MMMKIYTAAMLVASLAVAACGQSEEGNTQTVAAETTAPAGTNQSGASAQPSGEVHSGNGDITEISSDSVTISHGPVESIAWPAMTMTFRAPSPDMVQGLNVGDPVDFQFQKAGEQYVLTSIKKAQQ